MAAQTPPPFQIGTERPSSFQNETARDVDGLAMDDTILTVEETAALSRYGVFPANTIPRSRLQRLREVHFDDRCLTVGDSEFSLDEARQEPTELHTVVWHRGITGVPDVPTVVLWMLVRYLRDRIWLAYDELIRISKSKRLTYPWSHTHIR